MVDLRVLPQVICSVRYDKKSVSRLKAIEDIGAKSQSKL